MCHVFPGAVQSIRCDNIGGFAPFVSVGHLTGQQIGEDLWRGATSEDSAPLLLRACRNHEGRVAGGISARLKQQGDIEDD